jgi:iron complex outermembrane receptor protein
VIGGIREGNRLPSVPKFQISINATYTRTLTDTMDGYVTASFQHVGNRYTQASDQEDNPRSFVSGLPFGGASGNNATVLDLQLPSYEIDQSQRRAADGQRPGPHRLRQQPADENTLLSFDRERGGRARLGYSIGQPRTAGLTIRKSF